MDLLQHTIAWCKGEIYEGKMIFLAGAALFFISLAFWKFGTTPYAKAIVAPLGVLAALMLLVGIIMNTSNTARIQRFTEAAAADPTAHAKAELERTEDFIAWYPRTRWILFGVAVAGMLLAMFGSSPLVRSIGLVLMLLVLLGFTIDHFSEERALEYHARILEVVK